MTGGSVHKGLAREILQTLFIGTELSWLMTLLVFLSACFGEAARIPLAAAGLLYPFVYVTARLSRFRSWPAKAQAGAGTAAAVLALGGLAVFMPPAPLISLGSIKYWIVILVVGGFCFLRGGFAAVKRIDRVNFARSFQFGMLTLLAVTAFSALAHMRQSTAVALAVAFLVCGFSGLWLARIAEISENKRTLRATWVIMVAVALLAFVLVSAGIIVLFDHELLERALAVMYWLGEQVGRALRWFFSLFEPSEQPELLAPPPPMAGEGAADGGRAMSEAFRKWTRIIAHVMFTVSWCSFFAMILYHNILHLMRWLRKKMEPERAASYEETDVSFVDDIKALFQAIVRLAGKVWRRLSRLGNRLLGRRRTEEIAIAGIYRKMLAWGESKGAPRASDQTPYEYMERLTGLYPEFERAFRAITDSFVAARYGGYAPGETDMENAHKSWRAIKSKPRPSAGKRSLVAEPER